MNAKAPIVLGLAAICGLGAMYGVKQLIQRKPAQIEMREILVASRPIRIEEHVKKDLVVLKELPVGLVPPNSFSDFSQVEGRWAKIPILAGDPITDGKLAEKGAPTGLKAKVKPGMRAVAVRVDEQSGLSGFIQPGYRVDILQALAKSTVAEVVLEDILVLASGTVIDSTEERVIESKTVTLEVTPEQSTELTAAVRRGPVTLALRGFDDHEILTVEESEAPPVPEEVSEPEPDPEPEPPVIPNLAPEPLILAQSPTSEATPKSEVKNVSLTLIAGRSQPRLYTVGDAPEKNEPSRSMEPMTSSRPPSPEPANEPAPVDPTDRRPFQLDLPANEPAPQ